MTTDVEDTETEAAEKLAATPPPSPKDMQRLMGRLMAFVQKNPEKAYTSLEDLVEGMDKPASEASGQNQDEAPSAEDVKKNLIFRFGRSASRKAKRAALYSKDKAVQAKTKVKPWAKPVKEWTLEAVIAFSVAFTFSFLIAYLFTISPIAAWIILAGLLAQVIASCVAWGVKWWAKRKANKISDEEQTTEDVEAVVVTDEPVVVEPALV